MRRVIASDRDEVSLISGSTVSPVSSMSSNTQTRTSKRQTTTGGEEKTPTDEYWDWVAVGLFLMVTVDLLTSLYAAETVGVAHESNPVMRYLLSQSVAVVVLAHLAAVVLVSYFFYALFEVLKRRSGYGRWSSIVLELYIGLFVVAGLFVFANNLAVVVLGGSLL